MSLWQLIFDAREGLIVSVLRRAACALFGHARGHVVARGHVLVTYQCRRCWRVYREGSR